jgi:hypothetical protein
LRAAARKPDTQPKAWVCGLSFAGIAVSNPAGGNLSLIVFR